MKATHNTSSNRLLPIAMQIGSFFVAGTAISSAVLAVAARIFPTFSATTCIEVGSLAYRGSLIFPTLTLSTTACMGMGALAFTGGIACMILSDESTVIPATALSASVLATALKLASFANSWWIVPAFSLASVVGLTGTIQIMTHLS